MTRRVKLGYRIGKEGLSEGSSLGGFESVQMADGDTLLFPLFNLPKANCAGYAKRVAESLFGSLYVVGRTNGDAWNLRYFHKTIRLNPENPADHLIELFRRKRVEPGDLVGVDFPFSDYLETQRDLDGRKPEYTHIETILGIDSNGELRLGGQFIEDRRTITLPKLSSEKLTLVEVVKPQLLRGVMVAA